MLAVFACNVANEDGHTYINVQKDTAWAAFDSLEIAWKDSATGAGGILFQGNPSGLGETNKLPADGYGGQKIVVTFKGFKAHELVFEERRAFDGSNPGAFTREIIPVGPGTSADSEAALKRPVLSPIKADSVVSIGDSVVFTADATLGQGSLKSFAWDYKGDGTFENPHSLSGKSAHIEGGYRYPDKGTFKVALRILTDADSAATRKILVSVLQDVPIANAGPDVSAYVGDSVALHGQGHDALGRIEKTEWKIGDGPYLVASGDTTITAPATPQDMRAFFRVTDDDGQSAIDSAEIHVVSKTESNLIGLSVSQGALSPQFNPAVLAYSDTVPFDAKSVTVTATGTGEIRINDAVTTSGAPSQAIDLNSSSTPVTVSVKLAGTTGKTYSLTVVRPAPSANANLASLSTSAGALDTAFSPGDTLYEVTVPNGTTSATITAITASAAATLAINGFTLSSGAASGAINLAVGPNPVAVTVTAENGDRKNYVIRITRAGTGNTDLGGLVLSAGALSPSFSASQTSYSLTVPNATTSTGVTATVANASSTLTLNGKAAISGTAQILDLAVGSTLITVGVKAQNGDEKTYTIRVTRAGNGNADLSGLESAAGAVTPAFDPAVVFYELTAGNGTASISVTATVANASSSIAIDGQPATSGTAYALNLAVGVNSILITVTAQSGDKKTYTLQITRAGNGNADLSKLDVAGGTLAPAFAPERADYAVSVPNSQATANVTATVADSNAAITINGGKAVSGIAFPVTLTLGANTVAVTVKAQSGTNKTYTITITRALNGNADLEGLVLSAGAIAPAFSGSVTAYSLSVANNIASTTLTPKAVAPTSTITVNGTAVPSGSASAALPLIVGANSFAVVVTAQNGDKKTYSVQVTRAGDGNTDLSALIVSGGAISPVFSPATVFYSLSVANAITSATITPTASVPTSTITVNGAPVASGNESDPVSLNAGANTITIVVTAQSGAKSTYSVEITRAGNANADLSGLSLSAGSLSPAFASATNSYAISVANGVTSTTVTPATAAATSTVTVNGAPVASGAASAAIPLTVGTNIISIVVTAQNGSTKTYTLTITRAGDGNSDLSGLTASAGTLSPAFTAATTLYGFTVANNVTSTTVTPTVSIGTSTITVNGTAVASGTASAAISLNVGANPISIVVTAQNNTTKTYTLQVTRSQNGNADLSGLTVSGGSIAPAFAAATTSYSLTVGNGTTSVSVTPTVSAGTSSVSVNAIAVASGTASASIPLNVGANPISVVVTSQSGVTKTYTVTVTRAKNSNADLSALSPSAGSLSPAFAAATLAYSITVSNAIASMTFTPTTAAATSSVKVNGTAVTSGSASASIPLSVGTNAIPVVVTAEDGTVNTYTISVNRAANANADLSALSLTAGALSPAFAAGTTSYAVAAANSVTSSTVTPTVSAGTSTVTVNGAAVSSGSASAAIPLAIGPNTLTVEVTAQNGGKKQYTVVVTRQALVAAIGASDYGSYAVKQDGTLYAWGSNPWGQTNVPAGMKFIAAAGGWGHTIAVKTDGTVIGFGADGSGQIDIPPGLSGVVAVAAGQYFSVALKTDGTVVAWGENGSGQATVPPGLTGVKAIAAGQKFAVALKNDGTLVGWGTRGNGQMGWPAGLVGVKAIDCGDYHTVALLEDGTVAAWGSNFDGETTVPSGLSGVIAISAGAQNSFAVKSDGTVVGWGSNDLSQRDIPVGLTGVKSLATGLYHTLALKNDGTVVGWGENSSGAVTIPPGVN